MLISQQEIIDEILSITPILIFMKQFLLIIYTNGQDIFKIFFFIIITIEVLGL